MTKTIEMEIKNKIKSYMDAGFDLAQFIAEMGWEDWMNEFTSASDGEEITEREIKDIDEFLEGLWIEMED